MTTQLIMTEGLEPPSPSSGKLAMFASGGHFYAKADDGSVFPIGNSIRIETVLDATTITPNCAIADLVIQINTQALGSLTINAPTGTPNNGQKLEIRIKSSNAHTLVFNAAYDDGDQLTFPATLSGSGKIDRLLFDAVFADDGVTFSKWSLLSVNFGG